MPITDRFIKISILGIIGVYCVIGVTIGLYMVFDKDYRYMSLWYVNLSNSYVTYAKANSSYPEVVDQALENSKVALESAIKTDPLDALLWIRLSQIYGVGTQVDSEKAAAALSIGLKLRPGLQAELDRIRLREIQ